MMNKKLSLGQIIDQKKLKYTYQYISIIIINMYFTFDLQTFIDDVLMKEHHEIVISDIYKDICKCLEKNYDTHIFISFDMLVNEKMLLCLLKNKLIPDKMTFTGKHFIFDNLNSLFYSLIELYKNLSNYDEYRTMCESKIHSLKTFLSKLQSLMVRNNEELSELMSQLHMTTSPVELLNINGLTI